MTTEDTLANMPTDQLVLKLLQELAARVEKLEKKNETVEDQKSSAKSSQTDDSPDNPIVTTEERSTAASSSKEEDENEDARCATCGGLLGSQCHCIEIPYGYLIDEEELFEGEALISIEDRAHALQCNDPDHFVRLEKLGIAGVPEDGRFSFPNFWSPRVSHYLDRVIRNLDAINKIGIFCVADFDSHGASIMYGPGEPDSQVWRTSRIPWRGAKGTWPSSRTLRTPPRRFEFHSRPEELSRSAPWKRLIVFAGLSVIIPFWRSSRGDFVFFANRQFDDRAADLHFKAQESFSQYRTNSPNLFLKHLHTCHLSWFEVVVDNKRLLPSTSWKQGRLRGPKVTASLQQIAFTIQVMSDAGNRFWTVVVLLPPVPGCDLLTGNLLLEAQEAFPKFPLPIVLAKFILYPLAESLRGMITLSGYIDDLLGTGDEIFDVEAHDNLIFDDDLYTRSKRYFWVINCINEAEKAHGHSLHAWVTYRDKTLLLFGQELLQHGKNEWLKEFNNAMETCNDVHTKLEKLQKQFSEQRIKAVALRDGLFSASAVIESRASTRLGENVKLLTYVSIFYLLLAFCTSIWSTTDTFGFYNLAYTMVAIGLITYLVVFNLNQLVKFRKKNY